ncbi:MAG TPA: hybrid sensor histidine kinase/response regulator, partial [Burkholderiales bacterium]|nr:hybrid sensor histidine kinase/response regulator [Burkholderiales bacterium]
MGKDQAVREEQALYIQRNMPLGATAAALAVWTTVFLFRKTEVATHMLVWASLFTAGVIHALIDFRSWRGRLPEASEKWLRHTPVSAGCASCLLGAGAFVVLGVSQPELQLFYLCVVVVISVMSIFAYGPHYPTFVAMVMPVMLLTLMAFALGNSEFQWAIAVSQGVIILVVLHFAKTFNRVFRRSVELRFENRDLVQQLRRQIRVAESANMAKSRFLAAASHDLRQPMHALNLYLGAMSNTHLPEEAKPLLNNASECAAAMDDMFGALLDVSSLDAGAVKPELSIFPIASILDRVRLAFAPAAHDKGLRIDVRSCSASVHSDPALVERILGNLVSNAVRYTHKGRILIGCRRRGESLLLEVYDTGQGIDADKQALIFEEFYQASNAERDRSQGLGLGLAIVERLARLLNISVHLRTEAGKGSVFRFALPRAYAPWGNADTKAGAPGPLKLSLRDRFIVVVDDEKLVLDATRAVLEQHGSFVLTAASGLEAV